MSWKIRGGYNAEIYEDEGGEHRTICCLWGQGTARGRRDACMIHSAPEMYSLLKKALPYVPISSNKLRIHIQEILARIDKEDDA